VLAALARKQVAIELVVVVGEEHPLAPIPPLRDVMRQSGNNEAGDAGRGAVRGGRGGEG